MRRLSNFNFIFHPLFIIVSIFQVGFTFGWYRVRLSQIIEETIDYKFVFKVRASLDLEPQIHPKLKILIVDESTSGPGYSSRNSLDRWSKALSTIAQRRPRAIYIDKTFDQFDSGENASFVNTVRELNVPVFASAFFSQHEIRGREPLILDGSYKKYEAFAEIHQNEAQLFAYGPPLSILGAFKSVGHSVYEGNNHISPAVNVGKDKFLPHLALLGDFATSGLQPRRSVRVDFLTLQKYSERSVLLTLEQLQNDPDKPKPVVDADDVVLILPATLNNTSEWSQGPLGPIPRGYVVASVLNSRLQDRYLVGSEFGVLMCLLGWVLAVIYGAVLSPFWFFISLVVTSNIFRFSSVAFFIFGSTMIPAVFPAFMLTSQGIFTFVFKMSYQMRAKILAQAELELAKTVQQRFLPQDTYISKTLDIFGFFRPASECSGDWWAHLYVDEHRHIVLVGDVTGHGVPSALLAASMNASSDLLAQLSRKNALASLSASEILSHLNGSVCSVTKSELYCSVSLIDVNLKDRKLAYANAGHIPPIIIKRHGVPDGFGNSINVESLRTANNPLGVNPDENFSMASIDLTPGDRVLIYTDGLTEWFNRRGERLTPSAMRKRLLQLNDLPAREVPEKLVEAAMSIGSGTAQPDDITIVVIDYKG